MSGRHSGEPEGGLVIAIDGPSGSGKSSVSRQVAKRLGLGYLDTGAMYRAAAWWCREQGVDLTDTAAVAAETEAMDLAMELDPDQPTFHVAGTDVGAPIRLPEISAVVSQVATNLDARAILGARQRSLIGTECSDGHSGGRGVVAEGRDITTVIAPDADVRILLTADEDARTARRALEVHGVANKRTIAATRADVVGRDKKDATVVEFQIASDGVVTIDSTPMTLEETVDAVLALVEESTRGR